MSIVGARTFCLSKEECFKGRNNSRKMHFLELTRDTTPVSSVQGIAAQAVPAFLSTQGLVRPDLFLALDSF